MGSHMNRYPLWKYLTVLLALIAGFIYTLPNFFGESPAVQISSAKARLKPDTDTLNHVSDILKTAEISHTGLVLDNNGIKIRLSDSDTQLRTRDLLEKKFNPEKTGSSQCFTMRI